MARRLLSIGNWEVLAKQSGYQPARLAVLCGVSLGYLERFFKEQFHKTPGRRLREWQCRLVGELVARGYSTKAAAAESKFSNPRHCCREFKRIMGASPQTFAPPVGVVPKRSFLDNNVANGYSI